jgi:hypothetical protein
MKYLPTRPLEFANPSGKLALAESNSNRGVSIAWAANNTSRPVR